MRLRPSRLLRLLTAPLLALVMTAGAGVAAQAASDAAPVGWLDRVTLVPGGVKVFGWAWDADATGATSIVVTVDGAAVRASTSVPRPDVPLAYPGAGPNQGFDLTVPAASGTRKVCVTIVDAGGTQDKALPCRTMKVPGSSPFGDLAPVAATSTGVRLQGWAADIDATSAATLKVTVDSAVSTITATTTRADVLAAYPGLTVPTGYDATIPTTTGSHKVCVSVVNVGPGSTLTWPCQTVTVGTTLTAAATSSVPTAATTGVPDGTALTVHQGDLVITTPGTVVDGLDVRGFVEVRAANVTIRNSVIRGRSTTGSIGLVNVRTPTASLVIEDSTLAASTLSPYVDGLRGMNITARRLDISRVIDQVHVYGSNVRIEGSWLHDNAHFTSDPNWGGTPSHDDNVQIQAGSNITLVNNALSGSHSAGILITQDAGVVSTVAISRNLLDGGACTVNVKTTTTPPSAVSLTSNTFGLNQIYRGCAIKAATSIPLTLSGNVFTSGTTVTRTP